MVCRLPSEGVKGTHDEYLAHVIWYASGFPCRGPVATKDMACGYPSATRRQSTWWRPASAAGLIDTSVAPYAPCVLCALSLFMFPPACSEEIKRQDLAPVARPSLQLGVLGGPWGPWDAPSHDPWAAAPLDCGPSAKLSNSKKCLVRPGQVGPRETKKTQI